MKTLNNPVNIYLHILYPDGSGCGYFSKWNLDELLYYITHLEGQIRLSYNRNEEYYEIIAYEADHLQTLKNIEEN